MADQLKNQDTEIYNRYIFKWKQQNFQAPALKYENIHPIQLEPHDDCDQPSSYQSIPGNDHLNKHFHANHTDHQNCAQCQHFHFNHHQLSSDQAISEDQFFAKEEAILSLLNIEIVRFIKVLTVDDATLSSFF
jgi:hypothetical protein